MADLLSRASKVTILAGAGCADAHDALVALAQRLKAPVVHSLRGKQFVEYANPCDVGMTGLLGFSSGYKALQAADVVLMLGTDFPYRQFYPEKAKVIQVDIRGEQIGRRTSVALGVVGDVRETVTELLSVLPERRDGHHLASALADYAKAREGLDALAVEGTGGSQSAPPVRRSSAQRPGQRGRRVRGRRRNPHRLGRAVPLNEREAPVCWGRSPTPRWRTGSPRPSGHSSPTPGDR